MVSANINNSIKLTNRASNTRAWKCVAWISFIATTLWLLLFLWYEIARARDAYDAWCALPSWLLAIRFLQVVSVVALVRWFKISMVFPLVMVPLGLLAGVRFPVFAATEDSIRELLNSEPYFGIIGALKPYIIFSGLQIFGVLVSWKFFSTGKNKKDKKDMRDV